MKRSKPWMMLGGLALMAGCVAEPAPAPQPAPPPRPAPPRPAPPPPPQPQDWKDIALTPGEWSYSPAPGGSSAAFGVDGGAPSFILRCDRATRQVALLRASASEAPMTVRTSSLARTLAGSAAGATLPALDPFLDAMAFSRGRFTVETGGQPMLVIPAWPEPARVVEDCRE